jgi:hypothetical protein
VADHALYAGDASIWIGDTRATSHMTNNDVGMFDCSATDSKVNVGNGKALQALKSGKTKLQHLVDGKITTLIIENVLHVP